MFIATSKRPVRPPKPEYLENPSKPAPSAKQESVLEGYERMGPGGTNHNLLMSSKETDESQRVGVYIGTLEDEQYLYRRL